MYVCTTYLVYGHYQSVKLEMPQWTSFIQDAHVDHGFIHGVVKNETELERLLELHSRATLSDYISRYIAKT